MFQVEFLEKMEVRQIYYLQNMIYPVTTVEGYWAIGIN